MQIRPATPADVERLVGKFAANPVTQHHTPERWATQESGDGLFLLAHRAGQIVGHSMVLRQSKYAEVRADVDPVEINGLHAYAPNQGVGTALIAAAEAAAVEWGRPVIGLGVDLDNPGARRLYERLGYRMWAGPQVIDIWTEKAADGTVVRTHAEPCDYLVKTLD
jgi:ribosomal protein S18 acetylase RimI-like enzyme